MNNEPAFPSTTIAGDISQSTSGITLRDYFAAKAMQAMVQGAINVGVTIEDHGIAVIASHAYLQSDAMLMERERGDD